MTFTDLKDKCILKGVVCGYKPMNPPHPQPSKQTHAHTHTNRNSEPLMNPNLLSLICTVKTGLKCIHVSWSLLV